jgi:cysteine desulfurase
MHRVYLDNSATTPLLPEVLEAMRPYFIDRFGNASSIHHHGQETRAAVEAARESVAALIGCRASEVVLTSGGTESDNLGIFGVVRPGDHVITSTIEHHAVLNAAKHLEASGCEVTYIRVDGSGLVDPEHVRQALRPNTKLISLMMANIETGALRQIAEIGRIAADADVYLHTDAVQAAGKMPLQVSELACDLLTISGHKIHGPQGTGALYVRKGTAIRPLLYGGPHERKARAGTENVAGAVGRTAAALAQAGFERGQAQRLGKLRDRLEQGIWRCRART